MSNRLNENDFYQVVKNAPLTSIDLIVKNDQNQILLGYRKNQPAKDFWFVPGGRIYKDESISAAFERIVRLELETDLKYDPKYLHGVYEHLYETNFFERGEFGTHYIVLAHLIELKTPLSLSQNDQHESLKWFDMESILDHEKVHTNTKAYFENGVI